MENRRSQPAEPCNVLRMITDREAAQIARDVLQKKIPIPVDATEPARQLAYRLKTRPTLVEFHRDSTYWIVDIKQKKLLTWNEFPFSYGERHQFRPRLIWVSPQHCRVPTSSQEVM